MTTDAITIEQKAQRILQLADELGAGIVDCTTKQWLMPAFASHIQSIDLGFYASERFIEHVLENHFFTSVPSPATNITEAPASTLDTAMEAFEESPDMGTAMLPERGVAVSQGWHGGRRSVGCCAPTCATTRGAAGTYQQLAAAPDGRVGEYTYGPVLVDADQKAHAAWAAPVAVR